MLSIVFFSWVFHVRVRTSIRNERLRGASSIGGLRSVRPPHLDEVETMEIEDGRLGRLVVITATDGEVVRWRLDGPRTLRWGTDTHFDDQVADLRRRWHEALVAPAGATPAGPGPTP